MQPGDYKTWIIIGLFIMLFGIGIFALTRSHYRETKTRDKVEQPLMQGPLLDVETSPVEPLEQLGVDLNDPVALASLGDKYFERNNFKQAIKIYGKVLELDPNDVDTHNDLGLALHYTGSSEAAVETLTKGTQIMPSYQRIWLSLGFVLINSGRNVEAKIALKKTVDLGPDTVVGQEAKRMLGILK
jgi:tetratricopeptide (TPR) repeat protein